MILLLRPHLLIWVTVVLYDSDPGQHVLPPFRLEQILAVGGCEPQHVLASRVAVGDVNEAGLDADSQRLLLRLRGGMRHGILPVLVQCQGVASQNGVHLLPRPHASADALRTRENSATPTCVWRRTEGTVSKTHLVFISGKLPETEQPFFGGANKDIRGGIPP